MKAKDRKRLMMRQGLFCCFGLLRVGSTWQCFLLFDNASIFQKAERCLFRFSGFFCCFFNDPDLFVYKCI